MNFVYYFLCVFIGYCFGAYVVFSIYRNRGNLKDDIITKYEELDSTNQEIIRIHEEKEVIYKRMLDNDQTLIQRQRDYIAVLESRVSSLEGQNAT